jgi:hypothetical protein
MAKKRLPGSGEDFVVPVDKGHAHSKELRVKLPPGKAKKYDVWQKDIASDAPTTYNGSAIRWFNNFGLKLRKQGGTQDTVDTDPFEDEVDEYTVEVDAEPGITYLYFDGKTLGVLTIANGKASAKLKHGDPYVGGQP